MHVVRSYKIKPSANSFKFALYAVAQSSPSTAEKKSKLEPSSTGKHIKILLLRMYIVAKSQHVYAYCNTYISYVLK